MAKTVDDLTNELEDQKKKTAAAEKELRELKAARVTAAESEVEKKKKTLRDLMEELKEPFSPPTTP